MPIPMILAGLAAGAAGVASHMAAKEVNENAKQLMQQAQVMYDSEKQILEQKKESMEQSAQKLVEIKKELLEHSVANFMLIYSHLKDFDVTDVDTDKQLPQITPAELDELQELTSVYQNAVPGAVAGAATGTVVALAVNGTLPLVTTFLSAAGTMLSVGEVGAAVSVAGSALSLGAAMTPLSAIAAPVVLFTGILSGIQSDENLEKARVQYAQAEEAVEQMRTSEVLCDAMAQNCDIHKDFLIGVNVVFADYVQRMDKLVQKKCRRYKLDKIPAELLSKDDEELIRATRAMLKMIKTVMATSILNEDQKSISRESEALCQKVPEMWETVWNSVDSTSTKRNRRKLREKVTRQQQGELESAKKEQKQIDWSFVSELNLGEKFRTVAAIALGIGAQYLLREHVAALRLIAFAVVSLMIIDPLPESVFPELIRKLCQVVFAGGSAWLLWVLCNNHYTIIQRLILSRCLLLFVGVWLISKLTKPERFEDNIFRRVPWQVLRMICFGIGTVCLFAGLTECGLSVLIASIITELLFVYIAYRTAFYFDR